MKENDQSKVDEEKPEGLTIYKPEDQVFQKMHLCEYLGELYEAAENESEHAAEKKKDFHHTPARSVNNTYKCYAGCNPWGRGLRFESKH